ncbi:MAG: T9SS type A sorting domain-containing protein, partial [bacterium]
GRVGIYPSTIWNDSSFSFEKLTTGNGVWVDDYSNSGEAFEEWLAPAEVTIPEAFSLAQNYPNPFNPSTTLRFDLPEAAQVTLEVFDVAGRVVGAIHELPLPAGTHQIPFDGSGLPSGMYIYRLTAGDWQGCGKMMLLK